MILQNYFEEVLTSATNAMRNNLSMMSVPKIDEPLVSELIKQVQEIFTKEGQMLNLHGDFIVVGDLHGHIWDFVRILEHFGKPPQTNYLFLGDLIDRGNFSFETIFCIYYMKSQYPNNVYIIRGNHEFEEICSSYGFKNELNVLFPRTNIFQDFIDSFSYMPFGAILNSSYFCVHGGIGPNVKTIEDISKISLPLHHLYGGIPEEIIWSDPSDETTTFAPSPRDAGYLYGIDAVSSFLNQNHLKAIIRGHMTIQEGVKEELNGMVYTIHTASNCEKRYNCSGALEIKENLEKPIPHIFPPMERTPRRITTAPRNNLEGHKFIRKQSSLPPINPCMVPGSFTGIRMSLNKMCFPQSPTKAKVVFG